MVALRLATRDIALMDGKGMTTLKIDVDNLSEFPEESDHSTVDSSSCGTSRTSSKLSGSVEETDQSTVGSTSWTAIGPLPETPKGPAEDGTAAVSLLSPLLMRRRPAPGNFLKLDSLEDSGKPAKVESLLRQRALGAGKCLKLPGRVEAERSSDLTSVNGQYERKEALGSGSSSTVYRAVRRADGKEVALKLHHKIDEGASAVAAREHSMLNQVDHPNVVRAYDSFSCNDGVALVLEYFEGQTLETEVQRASGRRLEEDVALDLFGQLLGAIEHLHAKGIVHRDVKVANIMVSEDRKSLKLIDFNTATDSEPLTATGTPAYSPPEVLACEGWSSAGDVWTAGLCLHYMLVGRLPKRRNGIWDELCIDCEGSRLSGLSDRCKKVLTSALEVDSNIRPTATELLSYLR